VYFPVNELSKIIFAESTFAVTTIFPFGLSNTGVVGGLSLHEVTTNDSKVVNMYILCFMLKNE